MESWGFCVVPISERLRIVVSERMAGCRNAVNFVAGSDKSGCRIWMEFPEALRMLLRGQLRSVG